MQSFILVGFTPQDREAYLTSFCHTHHIALIDKVVIDERNEKGEIASLGIQEIKKIQATLFLKPIQGAKKILVLEHAQTLTREGQNALLKTLEEPPLHTFLCLVADKKNAFLPTILSRCTLIQGNTLHLLSEKEWTEKEVLWQTIQTAPVGEKLALAQSIAKDKETTQQFLYTTITALEKKLPATTDTKVLRLLQKAHMTIATTNATARLVMEHLFLSLNK